MKSKWLVLGTVFVVGILVLSGLAWGAILTLGRSVVSGRGASGSGVTVVVPSVDVSWNTRDRVRGSGDVVTKDVPVRDFDRVSLAGIGDVIVTQGETESLTIETDDNILPYIETEVRNGTLVIGLTEEARDKNLSPTMLLFHVSMKEVAGLDLSGAGDISAGSLDTDHLRIDLGGAGDVNIDALDAQSLTVNIGGAGSINVDALNAEESTVHLSGAGDIALAGQVERQGVFLNGAGNYRCGELESQRANVELTGAGNATVWATETLDVTIRGIGSIRYYGNPYVDAHQYGLGTLRRMGDR